MAKLPVHKIELTPKLGEMMERMISIAKKHQVVTLPYSRSAADQNGFAHFQIHIGGEPNGFDKIEKSAIYGLAALGLITHESNPENASMGTSNGIIILTNRAYEWVDYQKKNKRDKSIHRLLDGWRDTVLVAVAVLTVALTIIQIIQAIK